MTGIGYPRRRAVPSNDEVTAGLSRGAEVKDALDDMGLAFSAIEQRSAVRGGEMQRKYLQRARRGPGRRLTVDAEGLLRGAESKSASILLVGSKSRTSGPCGVLA